MLLLSPVCFERFESWQFKFVVRDVVLVNELTLCTMFNAMETHRNIVDLDYQSVF